MQTIRVHGRDPARLLRDLGLVRATAVAALLANGVLTPLFGPLFALGLVVDAIWGDLLTPRGLAALALNTSWISLALLGPVTALWLAWLGIAIAFITDPWGTSIEMSEGLADIK